MVSGAVVAGKAGVIGSSSRKRSRLAHMAGRALFFEHRMSAGQPAAAVDTGVLGPPLSRDPKQSQQQEQKAEPKLGALQRRRPLEII